MLTSAACPRTAAARCAASTNCEMARSEISSATTPMVTEARRTSPRAIALGTYPSSAAARRIRSRVSGATTPGTPLSTLLAVWKLTPERAATSRRDTYISPPSAAERAFA
ncbi:hypothetical protein GCM10009557_13480 [Virgisporangium ochraceum]